MAITWVGAGALVATPLSADPEDTAWRRHVLARSQPPGWWTQ